MTRGIGVLEAFSQEYEGTKKILNQLSEKVKSQKQCSNNYHLLKKHWIGCQLLFLKISAETTADQDPKSFILGPNSAPMFPLSSIPFFFRKFLSTKCTLVDKALAKCALMVQPQHGLRKIILFRSLRLGKSPRISVYGS